MRALLKKNRLRINQDLASYASRKYFSPACYAASVVTYPLLLEHLRGECIDVGCGDMPFKSLLEKHVDRYDSVDIEKRAPDVSYLADITDMSVIDNNHYDSALCLDVLEHVPDPSKALSEIYRILKQGGKLVCTVPHLSRLHEVPHDYYRYTQYGLAHLLEKAGFHVILLKPTGGLFCFLGHQVSSIFLLPIWHISILKDVAFQINKWFIVKLCYVVDNLFDKKKIFALGYVCVAEKRSPDSRSRLKSWQ